MIVWGGDDGTLSGANTGGRYNPDADQWQPTSVGSNTPDHRYSHTTIWNGAGIIIWGGQTQTEPTGTTIYDFLNTGAIYSSGSVPGPGNSLRGGKSSYIILNWSLVFGAGSYNVKRCNPSATGCIPGTVISTPTINQYSEPDDGLSHFYAVEAVNQCGATP